MYNPRLTPFIFNGRDLSPYLLVTNVSREIVPKRAVQTQQVSAQTLVASYGFEPMTLKVTCSLMKESMQDIADVRRMLAEVLYTQEPKKLLLPDERGTYYYALYTGGAIPQELVKYPEVEFEFLVPDPIAYGGHHEERVQTHKDGTTEDVMLVGGTYPTKPKITIACEPNFYPMEIANKTTGKKICFVEDFKSNQVVTIDCELERVTVSDFTIKKYPNGEEMVKANTRDIALDIENDFFDVKDGDILYHSPNVYKYTIEWDERFL